MKNKHITFLIVFSILALLAFFSQANAASPKVTLKAGHVPTYHDIKYVWYSGEGQIPVQLSFTAPWDLTNGPKQKTGTDVLVKPEDAYDSGRFPEATYAWKVSDGSYMFYKKTTSGLYWLGNSAPPGHPNASQSPAIFTPPMRQFPMPAKVGLQFVQNTTLVMPGSSAPMVITFKIVGKGKVIVAAGTFNDAVMVQAKIVPTAPGALQQFAYTWYAPFVGKVAEMYSLEGETKDLFTTASSFGWLKSCKMP